MVLPARSAMEAASCPLPSRDSTPSVFTASTVTPPSVLLYSAAAMLVATAAMSASPLEMAATTSSLAPLMVM